MELRSYRYFWTIAEYGNITKAAQALHITQPTLSRQLKEMEEELATPLFIRENKRLVLTDAGRYLKQRAEEIIELTERTEQEFLHQRQELFSGHISIGCIEGDNSDTLAMILEEFLSDYPQITFNIFSNTSDEISDKLDAGLLDVAILIEPVPTEKYHRLPLPRKEVWGIWVDQTAFISQNEVLKPKDIIGLPLIMPQRPEPQKLLADWAGTTVEELNIRGNFNLSFNVFSLVENHIGAAFGISGVELHHRTGSTKFIPLDPPISTHSVFVWKKHRVNSAVVDAFIKRMQESFQ